MNTRRSRDAKRTAVNILTLVFIGIATIALCFLFVSQNGRYGLKVGDGGGAVKTAETAGPDQTAGTSLDGGAGYGE